MSAATGELGNTVNPDRSVDTTKTEWGVSTDQSALAHLSIHALSAAVAAATAPRTALRSSEIEVTILGKRSNTTSTSASTSEQKASISQLFVFSCMHGGGGGGVDGAFIVQT
mmetsp:Transcript_49894/g.98578  ORF Transcript_49894/g.98578 Transcript_49894/m.98578 type:complete len:112 (+) Transcript_49894:122-457(+)